MKKDVRILVTGARSPAALEWVRLLAQAGCTVFAADTTRLTLTRFSRFLSGYHCYTAPRNNARLFAKDLQGICERKSIDWIIPTCEETFWFPETPALPAAVFSSAPTLIRKLHDKIYMAELCRHLNIQVPQTWSVVGAPPGHSQWILKPRFSRSGVHTRRVFGELSSFEIPVGFIAQPFVHGEELCFTGVAKEGVVLAAVCYKPVIRSRKNSGSIQGPAVAFEACHHPDLIQIGRQIIHHTGYTGMIGIDAIIPPDGNPVVLDINPRTTSGIHLLGTQLDVTALLDGQPCCPDTPAGLTAWIPLAARLSGFSPAGSNSKQWINVISPRKDPLPVIGQAATLWHLYRTAKKYSVSLLAASTADIEWNGDA